MTNKLIVIGTKTENIPVSVDVKDLEKLIISKSSSFSMHSLYTALRNKLIEELTGNSHLFAKDNSWYTKDTVIGSHSYSVENYIRDMTEEEKEVMKSLDDLQTLILMGDLKSLWMS